MKALLASLGNTITIAQKSVKSNIEDLADHAKSLTTETKKSVEAQSQEVSKKIQDELTVKLNTVFDEVLNEPITDKDVQSLITNGRNAASSRISKVSYKNALIAGGCSLAPGPWGLITVIPEIYLVSRNQIALIRDLSIAYGHKEKLNRELLMFLFATSIGTGGLGLAALHGSKILVKRSSLQVMQKMVTVLGGKVTQQALKSAVSKWLPVVGAGALAAWTKYSTQKVGEICCEMLEKEILITNEEVRELDIVEKHEKESDSKAMIESLKILINLAKINGLSSAETAFLNQKMEEFNLSEMTKNELAMALLSNKTLPIDYKLFSDGLDKALLIENMNSLAAADGLTAEEKLYIDEVKLSL
jgi:uncharacterized protein (DUF697 family)